MVKDNIKIQIRLIILLCIFLSIPYKGYVNKKVYDPGEKYQIFRNITRNKMTVYESILIIYNKNDKMEFYNLGNGHLEYVGDFEKIMYLETYEKDLMYHEERYNLYTFILKNDNLTIYKGDYLEELSMNNVDDFISSIYNNSFIKTKKIGPFIPRLQTPKEFYNNFKDYFFPYYLAEYEVK